MTAPFAEKFLDMPLLRRQDVEISRGHGKLSFYAWLSSVFNWTIHNTNEYQCKKKMRPETLFALFNYTQDTAASSERRRG
jgi:hypothetical protein